jgi:Uma2 family endonuclease
MSAEVAPRRLVTSEEFFALPDDGIDRDLINGVVVEWGTKLTPRHRKHARAEIRVGKLLGNWLDGQPEPRGEVVGGGAYFRLRNLQDPEAQTNVGIDVAYVSAALVSETPEEASFFDGPPVLAVEILSPSNTQEEIDDKVVLYLASGVSLVWVISTRHRTITIYRPDAEPTLVNALGELSAEPHLPGFRIQARLVFE